MLWKRVFTEAEVDFKVHRQLSSQWLFLFTDPFGADPFKESDPFKGTSPDDFFRRTDKSSVFGSSEPFIRRPTPPAKVWNPARFLPLKWCSLILLLSYLKPMLFCEKVKNEMSMFNDTRRFTVELRRDLHRFTWRANQCHKDTFVVDVLTSSLCRYFNEDLTASRNLCFVSFVFQPGTFSSGDPFKSHSPKPGTFRVASLDRSVLSPSQL